MGLRLVENDDWSVLQKGVRVYTAAIEFQIRKYGGCYPLAAAEVAQIHTVVAWLFHAVYTAACDTHSLV